MKRVINGKTYSKVLGIKQGSLLTAGKDGDIEEYKADPTDAGKVLTVGEDGGVSPAVGGVNLYSHLIEGRAALGWARAVVINDSNTPFTLDTFYEFLTKSTSSGDGYQHKCYPASSVPSQSGSDAIAVAFSYDSFNKKVTVVYNQLSNGSFGPNTQAIDSANDFIDTVTTI